MEERHVMDHTNKIITIIGLVFEAIGVIGLMIVLLLWNRIRDIYALAEADMTEAEYEMFTELLDFMGNLFIVMGIVLFIFVVINLVLFTKLVRGKLDEKTAKKVYLYQAIWGGINLLSNQITGILYLVSGVRGFNNQREETDIRDGI